ncbi:hypothetical protein L1987_28937 [Smallanthus sonchifolius]|uniref:Uncharacterized protein n=1 Tax=Smallanthus sonchifolius TaxID=185202 RepID=A0ACB9I0E3_9ASTR|nr:hypothetical protein L1987_28937 [Smallanthus sonchifolius]
MKTDLRTVVRIGEEIKTLKLIFNYISGGRIEVEVRSEPKWITTKAKEKQMKHLKLKHIYIDISSTMPPPCHLLVHLN